MTTTESSSNSGDFGGGLGFEHVERGARDPALADRVGERLLVDDAAPPGVDEPEGRLGVLRARRRTIRPTVSGVFGTWHDEEVGALDELLDRRHELDAELAGPFGAHVRVVGDEPHAEGVGALGDEHADAAEPDDAERLAVQLDALPLVTGSTRPSRRSRLACGMLRACASSSAIVCSAADEHVRLRRVHDHHAAAGRVGDVDVVERRSRPDRRRRGRCRPRALRR